MLLDLSIICQSKCRKNEYTFSTAGFLETVKWWVSGKLPPMNIPTYESFPLWKLPPRIFPPRKSPPPGKITPNEIPSPLINHTNERKNKIIEFFVLKKAVQYNIFIKITKVLFDTQTISQKILDLDTFFTEWKKSKYRTKAKIAEWHLLASCTSQRELKIGRLFE